MALDAFILGEYHKLYKMTKAELIDKIKDAPNDMKVICGRSSDCEYSPINSARECFVHERNGWYKVLYNFSDIPPNERNQWRRVLVLE